MTSFAKRLQYSKGRAVSKAYFFRKSRLSSAAVLVFLAAAAGAGIVAADLWAGTDRLGLLRRCGRFAHDVAGFLARRIRCAAAEGAGLLVLGLLRNILQKYLANRWK